jgi:Asp/Glu/hydantoin racemase
MTDRPATIGILMLKTRFPRIPGDVGNALTWPFPVTFKTVEPATPASVVTEGLSDARLLPAFLAAARELVAEGADGLTTSCGFLAPFQDEIARASGVPVAASSLMQLPLVERLLPRGRRAGVLTVSAASLGPRHLLAAGAAADTPVMGTEAGTELTRVLLGDLPDLDPAQAERDLLAAGQALVSAHPELGALVLECANMAPYSAALRHALGLPVYDIVSFITWFHAGLEPRRFPR